MHHDPEEQLYLKPDPFEDPYFEDRQLQILGICDMYKRRGSSSNSLLSRSSRKSLEVRKPSSCNLVVSESDEQSEIDELPKALTSILSQYDDENEIKSRSSQSVLNSFTQKEQSTPIQKSPRVLKQKNRDKVESRLSIDNSNKSKIYSQTTDTKSSHFDKIISQCGAVKLTGNDSYVLSECQAVFSIKLNKLLSETNDKENFLKSFEKEISDLNTFKKMLVHTQTSDDCQAARGPVQDPLMKLLLNVDCLQVDLLEILLGKLASIITEGDSKNGNSTLVACIIRQLRFINRVKGSDIAEKLFDIIEMSSLNVQREIIFSLPQIISVEEHEVATKQLLELLKFNSSLTHVVIDALTNLTLSAQLRSQVRDKILNRLDKCPPEHLPLMVQFIISRCDSNELTEVIDTLRKHLPFTMHHHEMRKEEMSRSQKKLKKMSDEGSYVKLTFENLKFSLMASKQMTDVWIKIITNIHNSAEFRCVDLVMLVLIYASVFGRKNQIVSLFRNKIKSFVVTGTHIHQAFQILPHLLMEYSAALLELSSVFLKSYETLVSDFAIVMYETAFVHFNFYVRQNVISDILLHIGTGTSACINASLSILCRLTENHKDILSQHTVSVMSLLMKLPDLEPTQVRNLVNVIAILIFSNPLESGGLQDELQMFIRKQISSSKMDQHKKGVVAAAMFAKHAAANSGDGDVNVNEINSLLEMSFGSSSSCDARRAFFNDELATLFREVKLNDRFIDFWQERTYRFAVENLFIRNIDLECEYFPMTLQFALDIDDDRKLVFPAVYFVKKAFEDKSSSNLLTCAPSFIRLLWCSEQNFERILPILSASVIMPELPVFDRFDTLGMTHKKLIMDCLFICSNYFIECINAFCTQKTSEKVLIRIKQLMELRKLIARHLHKIPDYSPPICQYYAPVQKMNLKKTTESNKQKRGRKRKLGDEGNENSKAPAGDGEVPGTSASVSAETQSHTATPVCEDGNLHLCRGYFREIHCHVFKLLRMDLKLNPTKVFKKTKLSDAMINEEAWYYKATEKAELDSADLLFLLEEFIYKAEQVLKDKKYLVLHKGKSSNSAIEYLSTETFVAGAIKILPKLCGKIELLSSYCKDLISSNDKVLDAPGMYPKDSADIKLSLAAALKVVAELISWHGFRGSNYKSFLKDALAGIAKRGNPSTQENTISVLAVDAGNYLTGFADDVLLISGGLSIVKAVQSCLDYCQVRTATQKCSLAKVCYDLLIRPWFTVTGTPEKGAVFNQHVNSLLKTYFSVVDNKLDVVKNVTQIVFEECDALTGNDSNLKTFKTITKSNFPLMYRSLCEALVSGVSESLSRVKDDHESCLKIWGDVIQTLLQLVGVVKIHSSRINLSSLLKRSQSIIQLFLSKGMPVMESALRVKSTEVLKLMKSLQAVTRFLHSICCHSKLTSDATVGAHVPAIRSLCERLTLEVKGMLILNKIPLDCITIATLKNKDLQGNDIQSQETPEEESEEECQLLSEEHEDEVLVSENEEGEGEGEEEEEEGDGEPGEGDMSTQESNSEVY